MNPTVDPTMDAIVDPTVDAMATLGRDGHFRPIGRGVGWQTDGAGVGDETGSVLWGGGQDRPLASLDGIAMSGRFRAWKGRSGRRYVFSIFPLNGTSDGIDDLPAEGGAVVIGVARQEDGTRLPLFVAESGAIPEIFFRGSLVNALRERHDCELHLHLMADGGEQRRSIVADLQA